MASSATYRKLVTLTAIAALVGWELGRASEPGQRPRPPRDHETNTATAEPGQAPVEGPAESAGESGAEPVGKVVKSDAEWMRQLTRAQYFVTRLKATEPAWSGRYARGHWKGVFTCVCCGAELFSSEHKFNSGTGWPSFWRPMKQGRLTSAPDYSDGTLRIEVNCARCDAHLGHVFNDGPPPTGLRFCINSTSLKIIPFEKAEKAKQARAKAEAEAKAREDAKTGEDAKSPTDRPDESKTDTPDAAPGSDKP